MNFICMLLDGAYPQDIRVRKEAESLAEFGKNVLVVCPRKQNQIKQEIINGVHIYRIGKNYSLYKKGINDIIESVTDINPFFYFNLKKVLKNYSVEFLHVHDLPLAGTGYAFKNRIKKNIILDLHENYPEALKTWFSWKKSKLIRLKNTIFFNPKNWSKKEEKYCNRYDKIVCVVEEMKEKLIHNFKIASEKLVVISNYEKKDFSKNFNLEVAQSILDNNCFSITYVGGFGPHRGLDTAIKAMQKILRDVPKAKLFLIGKGSFDVEQKLRALVSELKLESSVKFVGYRPFNEVATIMKKSNLNIIPHKANEHTDNTIPHKLFQIMMSRSLLLVSSCKPLKRIVEKYDAGLVFEADNSDDFALKVVEAYRNYEGLKYKTEHAYMAVMDKGENWDEESLKLVNLYDKLKV
ncbi:glycosyltransferase [Aureibaculum marinum]|uniref:Glycosyltransferase n=1 Tax=Aureibaculum marinum TaxID=2487930 RepID=A0A3N4NYZ4_9FLAO|nr:glycosyltransferase [Aureibaculum marinum]RPE00048.1 glycosyltransferase [Aureibaculum marinum]